MVDEQANSPDRDEFRSPSEVATPEIDPAAQSLADALRVSFRLLGIIMIFVLVAFLLTGIESIEPQEQGIVKVFGRVVGTAEPGLAYNWPFPIGEIEIIKVQERTVIVDDFWMHETPQDRAKKDLLSRQSSGVLVPGKDGALLTGDRNLLHVKLACSYIIRESLAYKKGIAIERWGEKREKDRQDAQDDRRSDEEKSFEEVLRAIICNVAIKAAARRTADSIQRDEQAEFLREIRDGTEAELRVLLGVDDSGWEGITIRKILMGNKTVPLRALRAYGEAQSASTNKGKKIKAAKAEAVTILNAVAGPNYRLLVGDLYGPATAARASGKPDESIKTGLIQQYNAARRSGDKVAAATLLGRIDKELLSSTTLGEASRILTEAQADKTSTIEQAKGRYRRFSQLLPEFKRSPEFFMQRLWVTAKEEILNSPLVEIIYLPRGQRKMVLEIRPDPRIQKGIKREQISRKKEEKAKSKGGS